MNAAYPLAPKRDKLHRIASVFAREADIDYKLAMVTHR